MSEQLKTQQLDLNYGAKEKEKNYVADMIEKKTVEELFELEKSNLKTKIIRKFHNDNMKQWIDNPNKYSSQMDQINDLIKNNSKYNLSNIKSGASKQILLTQIIADMCIHEIGKEKIKDKLSSRNNDLDYKSNAFDGIMGPNTFYVLAKVAKEKGIKFNGIIDDKLLNAMINTCNVRKEEETVNDIKDHKNQVVLKKSKTSPFSDNNISGDKKQKIEDTQIQKKEEKEKKVVEEKKPIDTKNNNIAGAIKKSETVVSPEVQSNNKEQKNVFDKESFVDELKSLGMKEIDMRIVNNIFNDYSIDLIKSSFDSFKQRINNKKEYVNFHKIVDRGQTALIWIRGYIIDIIVMQEMKKNNISDRKLKDLSVLTSQEIVEEQKNKKIDEKLIREIVKNKVIKSNEKIDKGEVNKTITKDQSDNGRKVESTNSQDIVADDQEVKYINEDYIERFQYLSKIVPNFLPSGIDTKSISLDNLPVIVRHIQKQNNLTVNGKIDKPTLDWLLEQYDIYDNKNK